MKTTLIAAGDMFITQKPPYLESEEFAALRDLILSHEVRFANLEMTFHETEGFPAAVSGGTWAMTHPERLSDVLSYGFNLFNTANNHTGDYGTGGVLATIHNLRDRKMIFSGTGKDLQDASAPCYLSLPHMKIALISACATCSEEARAGASIPKMPGRPGLNPLRYEVIRHVTPDQFEALSRIADATCINAKKNYNIKNGYSLPYPDGTLAFGNAGLFVKDDHTWIETRPNQQDLDRILSEIKKAKEEADLVLFSLHSHEFAGEDVLVPAAFTETFARACIDAGVTVFLGHGPHQLQGVECYHGGLIFYSIGNFLFQTELVEVQPADAFLNKNLPVDTTIEDYMNLRSKNGTVGYGVDPNIWRSVLPSITIEDGKITQALVYPVDLGISDPKERKGLPRLSGSRETLEHLIHLSEPYGTQITILPEGVGVIQL